MDNNEKTISPVKIHKVYEDTISVQVSGKKSIALKQLKDFQGNNLKVSLNAIYEEIVIEDAIIGKEKDSELGEFYSIVLLFDMETMRWLAELQEQDELQHIAFIVEDNVLFTAPLISSTLNGIIALNPIASLEDAKGIRSAFLDGKQYDEDFEVFDEDKLGKLYSTLYQKQLQLLNRCIAQDPNDALSLKRRCNIFYSTEDFEKAKADIDTILQLKNNDVDSWSMKADICLHFGQFHEAIECCNKVISLGEERAYFGDNLWQAFFSLGELDKALREVNYLIEFDANQLGMVLPSHFGMRAETYAAIGMYEEALEDCQTVIELGDVMPSVYNNMAWSYFKLGRYTEALDMSEKSIEMEPEIADNFDTRGHIYEAMGKKDNAISDFKKAIALDPELLESIEGLKRLAGFN